MQASMELNEFILGKLNFVKKRVEGKARNNDC